MTVKFEIPDVSDKLLALAGKKRAVTLPADAYRKFGPYVSIKAIREPFIRALLRPEGHKPPEGWFYPDEIMFTEVNDNA